jgi:hypothetical protein
MQGRKEGVVDVDVNCNYMTFHRVVVVEIGHVRRCWKARTSPHSQQLTKNSIIRRTC